MKVEDFWKVFSLQFTHYDYFFISKYYRVLCVNVPTVTVTFSGQNNDKYRLLEEQGAF